MPIMKCFTFSAAIFPLFFSLSSSSEADLIVLTSHGPVRGTILISSRSNRPFFAFMGIPYAKPPVGDLRFKPLQPAESWTEVKNATVEGSMCPQVSEWTNAAEGEEDCLFINVFTPKLPSGPNATLLAVMAVIHGGGFTIGSGNRNALGPDFLVDEDVVIVTFNYRLGLLGFLSLQNSEVPGNNGLKDETFALRWVKQNIDRFGGDPSKVTVAGNSAGAAAVHFQVLSPMSRGLFQRAIEESGSALNPWAFQSASKSVDMAFRVGKFLGTNTTDKNELLRYLKSLPMEQLWRVVTSRDFKFLPTTEINITNDEVFLPDMPINMINAGNFNKVYYLIGVTSREGIIIVQKALRKLYVLRDVRNLTDSVFLSEFGLKKSDPRFHEAAAKFRESYFGDSTNVTLLQRINFLSDFWYRRGVYCTFKRQAALSKRPVYVYMFSFSGYMNLYKERSGGSDIPGASHADELGYLYRSTFTNKTFVPGSPELEMSKRIVRLWANFVKTGNPTPEADPLLQNVAWKPLTKTEFPYLDIDTNLTLQHDLLKKAMNFWDQLARNYTTHTC
ncbi:juvenile hormone esterase-like isoform X1 [Periplaneta americana]|uniref:juvenile hormone esterase-like isoform X1 n=1 Tax=Periplaneta americana TaxID=6978 RepID=UPI0037E8F428